MRIYEIDDYYHIDLQKVVAIHQYMNRVKSKDRRNSCSVYDCWIEITIDSGKTITIDCGDNIQKLMETYDLLLKGWQTFVGDLPENNLELPNNLSAN